MSQDRPSLDQIFAGSQIPSQPSIPQNRPSLDQIFGGMGAQNQTSQQQFPTSAMQTIRAMQQDPASIPNATIRGFSQGYTGGFGDEISGAVNAISNSIPYKQTRNQERSLNQQASSKYPNLYNASQTFGMGLSPLSRLGVAPSAAVMSYGLSGSENPVEQTKDVALGTGAALATQGLLNRAANLANKVATPKELPKELQNLEPLLKADGNTLFSKSPNTIQSGLRANKKISEMYDAANIETKAANEAARDAGNNTPIEAPQVYDRLNSIIGSLENKLAPGTPENNALMQLSSIRDSLTEKNPIISSSAGEKPSPRTILPSDLMDIEKAINAGLSDNKFLNSGTGKSLNFKKVVQDALAQASEANPEFGQKYQDYKNKATNLMKVFVDNDSLKPFWQPEDYIAWKANQNNPDATPFAAQTLTRANKVLDNLNTKDLGKINAVVNALPPEQANQLMREAFIKAKKDQTSLGNAILGIFTHSPVTTVETALRSVVSKQTSPNIQQAVKNIKGLKK